MKILISGATGSVGGELAKALSGRGVSFRAMVRSPERAGTLASLPGIELVRGDFDDVETLSRALRGVERAFLLTSSSERAEAQQRAFVEAARREGVRHVVKLSQWAADQRSPVRFLRYHAAVEAAIVDSEMAYTFLRPNLFMQGLLAFRAAIVAKGQFFASAEDARISAIDVRDIAEVAAAALVEQGHEGKVYDLTGPEALTHAEMAAQLSSALGRPIAFVNVPEAAMRGALLGAGLPEWQADGLLEDYAHYRRGEAATVTSGVKDATGRAPRTFSTFANDYAQALS
ncbi:SDR family oxidoreductase [Polyangium aurulentum]|uniref:SDR family oxidoreductase n=1 Tax=Polyangium aurulentum TaxID=2567896 RepID=UPI0010AE8053|nr:SDR family oxidoreductase [Polyangium aurulentum]UQA58605.1 SDR family oxidoreductase [Polyangium aurulentum]